MKQVIKVLGEIRLSALLATSLGATVVFQLFVGMVIFLAWSTSGITTRVGIPVPVMAKGVAWIAYWPAFLTIGDRYESDESFISSVLYSSLVWFFILALTLFVARRVIRITSPEEPIKSATAQRP